ncbi:hypothetical protein HYFRA_00002142 [Hymenoscyphus fraxineus]|uniref:F-box domain-containing protein n=1 Tax=Hymenoscyphus fraxineus TaxID=746836 RepID=A0A9N9KKN6_9HELO|nr:hypothetical protein HYFRA_00002142 [Hymenoscyphus fraxineus]
MAIVLFPVEVLEYIAEYAMPEDFESFSMTCKSFHAGGGKFREKHNLLKKRYRHFKYDERQFPWYKDVEAYATREKGDILCISPHQLLLQICEEPLIARYIITADFNLRDEFRGKERSIVLEQLELSSVLPELMESLPWVKAGQAGLFEVKDCLIQEYQYVDNFDQGLRQSYVLATTVLLTLLPNVIELVVNARDHTLFYHDVNSEYGPRIITIAWELLWSIVHTANEDNSLAASLCKLDSLTLDTHRYDGLLGFLEATPLLYMERLKSFHMANITTSGHEYMSNAWKDYEMPATANFGANLQTAIFHRIRCSDSELGEFLSKLSQLRKLELLDLDYLREHDYRGPICQDYVSAIENSAREKLEEVSLVFGIAISSRNGERGSISFTSFQKLKSLTLNFDVFFIPWKGSIWLQHDVYELSDESEEEMEFSLINTEVTRPTTAEATTAEGSDRGYTLTAILDNPELESVTKSHLLSERLPTTIQNVTIRVNGLLTCAKALKCFLTDMDQDKSEQLPRLNSITLQNEATNGMLPSMLESMAKEQREALTWLSSCDKIRWTDDMGGDVSTTLEDILMAQNASNYELGETSSWLS